MTTFYIDGEFERLITQEGEKYKKLNNLEIIPNDNTNIQLFKNENGKYNIYKEYNFNEVIEIKQEYDYDNFKYKLILNKKVIYNKNEFTNFKLLINGNCNIIETFTMFYE